MKRGDVVLVRFPHPAGVRGKKRPAVVIQADRYRSQVATLVVAEIRTNVVMKGDPACLFIDATTFDGKATGALRDSVASCLALPTVYASDVAAVIGSLFSAMRQELAACLKAALDLP